ncbi:hypothetical protein [Nocardioides sp. B-3]|uniref:hypothetical protein n=1 Tax=Nocardioides sp. B-3 TaxID=2895565 RepID=UPI0021538D8E|nr:hypothetical protein [Nocardioides sp. B-3]UUZ58761.1 hypothetical protein LP418_22115 [Nocardioides sp. B-3]
MSWPALALSVPPTARAVAWGPLVVVTTALLPVAGISRLIDGRPTSPGMLAVATLSAVALDATHDPAERLPAPTPVSALARGLLRVVLVATPATAALVAVTALLPGRSEMAALPVTWVFLDPVLGSVLGVAVDGITGWWYTDPLAVSAVALVAIGLGRRP